MRPRWSVHGVESGRNDDLLPDCIGCGASTDVAGPRLIGLAITP